MGLKCGQNRDTDNAKKKSCLGNHQKSPHRRKRRKFEDNIQKNLMMTNDKLTSRQSYFKIVQFISYQNNTFLCVSIHIPVFR
jgi:hypothetical protein